MNIKPGTTTRFVFVILTFIISTSVQAITYNVNRTVGSTGAIIGTIDTDDTLGQISLTSNITNWDLDLTIGTTTVNIPSPGGGTLQSGLLFTATPTELQWVLGNSASFGGASFCLVGCGLGNTQWRMLGNGFEVIENIAGEIDQNTTHPLNSTVVLGTAAVPVPAALWLMISGMIGLLGLGRRTQA
jgi:hypothetical protein